MSVSDSNEIQALAETQDGPVTRSGVRTTLRIDAERPIPVHPSATVAPIDPDRHAHMQRDLDRLHSAVLADQAQMRQSTNWLVASQAILIHAFLMLLVISSTGALARNLWLQTGLALLGLASATALGGAIRRSRQTLAMLMLQRRAIDVELAKAAGRTPSLPREQGVCVGTVLGPVFVTIWFGLLVYCFLVAT
jgi:hypothetical protein